VRIVFDVTPLSHPRTGVGNYIRGSLLGLAEVAAGKHELVAWAPTSVAGARLVAEALDGIPVERRIARLPFAHAWRTIWSRAGRPPAERFVGPLDVLHFSDWMFPPQRSGVRSTMIHDLVPLRFPEWTTARTRSMHAAKYRNAARTCDLLFVNSRYTGRETEELLSVSADRIRVAYPGVEPRFRTEGDRADLGRPYAVTVATLEPRKNLETLLAAHRLEPHGLALAIAHVDEARAKLTGSRPFVPLEGVRLSRELMFADSGKAARELDFKPGPVGSALERAVRWYRTHDYCA